MFLYLNRANEHKYRDRNLTHELDKKIAIILVLAQKGFHGQNITLII